VALLISKIRDRFLIVRTEEPLWQSLKRPSETRILTNFKVNTLGEESFLDDVKDLLEEILEE